MGWGPTDPGVPRVHFLLPVPRTHPLGPGTTRFVLSGSVRESHLGPFVRSPALGGHGLPMYEEGLRSPNSPAGPRIWFRGG